MPLAIARQRRRALLGRVASMCGRWMVWQVEAGEKRVWDWKMLSECGEGRGGRLYLVWDGCWVLKRERYSTYCSFSPDQAKRALGGARVR